MTLTKEDRKACYEHALKAYEDEGYDRGICQLLYNYLVTTRRKPKDADDWMENEMGDQFPEFYSFKPEGRTPFEFWFSSTEERIKILKQCIKMLK